jgi:hypothetical protein
MKHWQDYFRSSYELVIEAEGKSKVYLDEEIESYIVRLLAKWFDRNDVPPDTPVAILMMSAMQETRERDKHLAEVADICLFYDSFKIKHQRWPTVNYYKDMGTTAYGLAYTSGHNNIYSQLESNFILCSRILGNIKSQSSYK